MHYLAERIQECFVVEIVKFGRGSSVAAVVWEMWSRGLKLRSKMCSKERGLKKLPYN